MAMSDLDQKTRVVQVENDAKVLSQLKVDVSNRSFWR